MSWNYVRVPEIAGLQTRWTHLSEIGEFGLITIFLEGHAITSDNEAGLASGHNDIELSQAGRSQAAGEKRQRYESIKIDTVFTYDLRRAYETAQIMFERKNVPIIQDARLRSWDYGNLTQRSRAEVTVV